MTKKKMMIIVSTTATTAILAAIIVASVATAAILGGCVKTEDHKYQIEDSKDVDRAWTDHGMSCHTKVVEVEGHKYIIMDGYYSGGIVHAASCQCMDK